MNLKKLKVLIAKYEKGDDQAIRYFYQCLKNVAESELRLKQVGLSEWC